MRMADLGFLLTGVFLNAGAQLGLKAATQQSGPISLKWPEGFTAGLQVAQIPAFWIAMTAYGMSVVVWIIGLSRVPVSQAYPLLSVGYGINAVLAWWLFGEALSLQRIVGIGVVMAGVVLVARS